MAWRMVALRKQYKQKHHYSLLRSYVFFSPWFYYIWTFFVFEDVLSWFQVLLKISEFLAIGAGDLSLSEHFFSLLKTVKRINIFVFNVPRHLLSKYLFQFSLKFFIAFLFSSLLNNSAYSNSCCWWSCCNWTLGGLDLKKNVHSVEKVNTDFTIMYS